MFKDVKVGDVVYVLTEIKIRFSGSKYFWLPKKVLRVTKTQFVTREKSEREYKQCFYKENGNQVGVWGVAMRLGDNNWHYGKVIDQTKEYNELKERMHLGDELSIILNELRLTRLNTVPLEKLKDLIKLMKEVKNYDKH